MHWPRNPQGGPVSKRSKRSLDLLCLRSIRADPLRDQSLLYCLPFADQRFLLNSHGSHLFSALRGHSRKSCSLQNLVLIALLAHL